MSTLRDRSEELSLITEHTTKNSKTLVQQLCSVYIKNPAKGVKEVWKRLDERFGSSIVVTKAHLDKLTQFLNIGEKVTRAWRPLARAGMRQK